MSSVTLWTSELSPYSLKIKACLEFKQIPYRCLPQLSEPLKSLLTAVKVEWGKRRNKIYKYPEMSELDEYPGVPYLIESDGRIQYDSTAIAYWLDDQVKVGTSLWPKDPKLAFVARLLDDAMDEFGLYMAHHLRWLISPHTNDAGKRLHKEFGSLLFWSGEEKFAREFSRRQTSRLPYLFSMPPQDFKQQLPDYLTAPIQQGWPQTHTLLNEAWTDFLLCLEKILRSQPYLLGERFSMADASLYGMFGMLLDDPTANKDMQARAPTLHQWLVDIRAGRHCNNISDKPLYLSDELLPLLELVSEVFLPLMQQNETAYNEKKQQGETLFNEAAWRKNRALYTGELRGHPYKSVVKTFQIQVWQDLQAAWQRLSPLHRKELSEQVSGLTQL
jgi:glutathione S-transferase